MAKYRFFLMTFHSFKVNVIKCMQVLCIIEANTEGLLKRFFFSTSPPLFLPRKQGTLCNGATCGSYYRTCSVI